VSPARILEGIVAAAAQISKSLSLQRIRLEAHMLTWTSLLLSLGAKKL
jgi:hypothetical protein